MRREFSKLTKVNRFRHAEGRCEHVDDKGHRCNKHLMAGDTFYDHDLADGLGGEPTFENCRVLCRTHHDIKTRHHDVPRIAKTKRQNTKLALGIRPRSSRPMAGGKQSKFKRKVSGEVVLR